MEQTDRRRVYLSKQGLEEAKTLFFSRFGPEMRTGVETVQADSASGRVTAEPVFAKLSAPSFHSAAMDGIAVEAEQTYGITEREPKVLGVGRDALWINTGQPLPKGFNAVIMVEKIHELEEGRLEIRAPAVPWQNVRKVGEDIVATQLLLPQNHRIRPYDVGALLSGGVSTIRVWERPRVAIIPTGSELVHHGRVGEKGLKTGQIVEYNSSVLAELVRECNAVPQVYEIVADEEEKIEEALESAVESDAHVVIINAGSSAGSRDYTVHVVGKMGEILTHGVAMMPGKPTILGNVRGKPVIGNPGYAVSSALSFEQFVRPLLYRLQGCRPPRRAKVKVQPTRDIPSKLGVEEFLRVNIGKVEEKYCATPLARAAGSVTTLTRAEGIIRIPALSEGVSQDEELDAALLVEPDDLLNTVLVIGSHDITIDVLADEVMAGGAHVRVSSGNVGSLGGLMALKKGICHMAGSHLLDTETGEYNLSCVKRYLSGVPVTIFHLVLRDQGLIVAKGNPKGIKGVGDLSREDVYFVNRQAGAGTRVLLDYRLGEQGISPERINGYRHEEYTHMAVAVDVLSGTADCGMGIYAAAKALDLDFIPVVREQYDLIVPTVVVEQSNVKTVLEATRTQRFRDRVQSMGGYDPSKSGELWVQWDGSTF